MRMLIALLVLLAVPVGAGDALSPGETVRRYLTALKAGDFAAAYPLIGRDMAQSKTRDEWTNEQRWLMQMAEVKIDAFEVYPGTIEGDRAFVPNRLRAADAFRGGLGVDEHELYTLVREAGGWRITRQQIVEPGDVGRWFPPAAAETPR